MFATATQVTTVYTSKEQSNLLLKSEINLQPSSFWSVITLEQTSPWDVIYATHMTKRLAQDDMSLDETTVPIIRDEIYIKMTKNRSRKRKYMRQKRDVTKYSLFDARETAISKADETFDADNLKLGDDKNT